MFFNTLRRVCVWRKLILIVIPFLSGCTGVEPYNVSSFSTKMSFDRGEPAQTQTEEKVFGSGRVSIALLLPQTGGNQAQEIAQAFEKAVQLAVSDLKNPNIRIFVKDTGGSFEGGQRAAREALAEGAALILGPVFSQAVAGAASEARSAQIPVLAFSTDTSVAGEGVYLLSFLPQGDVTRIVSWAISQGRHSFAALVPDTAYGTVVEAALRRAISESGGALIRFVRYQANSEGSNLDALSKKIEEISEVAQQSDAVFIPAKGMDSAPIAEALRQAGFQKERVVFLGSGQWDGLTVEAAPALEGAWYPAPSEKGFLRFSRRYHAKFGSIPPRNASLAYDATVLAATLLRNMTPPENAFSQETLTRPNGFFGIDGLFRFQKDGTNVRGLAVYEMQKGGARTVSPAPRSFSGF